MEKAANDLHSSLDHYDGRSINTRSEYNDYNVALESVAQRHIKNYAEAYGSSPTFSEAEDFVRLARISNFSTYGSLHYTTHTDTSHSVKDDVVRRIIKVGLRDDPGRRRKGSLVDAVLPDTDMRHFESRVRTLSFHKVKPKPELHESLDSLIEDLRGVMDAAAASDSHAKVQEQFGYHATDYIGNNLQAAEVAAASNQPYALFGKLICPNHSLG